MCGSERDLCQIWQYCEEMYVNSCDWCLSCIKTSHYIIQYNYALYNASSLPATQPSDWSGSYITWQSRTNAVNILLLLPEPVSQVFGSLVCEIEGSAWSGHHQRSVSTRWTVSSTELTARSKYIDDENLIEWIVYVSNQCTYSWLFQQWIQVSRCHILCVITWSIAMHLPCWRDHRSWNH